MKAGRSTRTFAVLAAASLVLGAFVAGPADARKKKKKKPPVCAPYTPTEWSADQPINVVTDAHTAEAPLVVEVETAEGLGLSDSAPPGEASEFSTLVTNSYANVQVDSATPETGLYAQIVFPEYEDYDLFIRNDDGSAAAYSAGGPPWAGPNDGTGSGGAAAPGSETVSGLASTDCQGYLVDVASATTPGGTITLNLWLGEVVYTPGG